MCINFECTCHVSCLVGHLREMHGKWPVAMPVALCAFTSSCMHMHIRMCVFELKVLVMAGQLKRENPSLQEDVVLIRALRDSNLPKFLKEDATLFRVSLQYNACRSCTCIYM